MSISSNFKALPKSTKRLMSLGLIIGLVIALPLFIWSILNLTFDIRKEAQSPTTIDITNEPIIGYSDAPVTIIEYADFQCPFCKAFVDNTLSTILANYPTQVKVVFKDFPLTSIHPLAEKAAIAGQCAFAQNKFWQMHDLLFAKQDTLVESDFADFATQLDLDTTAFNDCYTNQTPLAEINADLAEGQTFGVTGTPTFFINGTKLEGSQPYESFKTIIDQNLVDDLYFKDNGNTVTFTTTNQTPNISINPDDFVDGQTYSVNVNFTLQNNLKYQEASTSAIPVILLVDNVFKVSKDVQYSLIAAHTDGFMDTLTANFVAHNNSTNIKVQIDPNNIFSESNEANNTFDQTFTQITASPTTTGSPSPTATATTVSSASPTSVATATPTASPTSEPITEGEPNSCGGTCGSNYNCKANLYCYQGYCRNPICSEKTDCSCSSATNAPTSTPTTKSIASVVSTKKSTSKPTPTSTTGVSKATLKTPNSSSDEVGQSNAPENMFWAKYAIYIFGAFVLIVITSIILAVKKKNAQDIPHILPPTNI